MSVRSGLMVLLIHEPRYGAQLRAEFEARTGGTWPLNVGQVYTTLGRLERDGLVEQVGEPDDEGRIRYGLTGPGREAVQQWWRSPVERTDAPRDELAIKLALAVTTQGVDVRSVVQTQRTATMRHLLDLTRLKGRDGGGDDPGDDRDLAWRLVLESLIFAAEAEVRWLDHVESALAKAAAGRAHATADRAGSDRGVADRAGADEDADDAGRVASARAGRVTRRGPQGGTR